MFELLSFFGGKRQGNGRNILLKVTQNVYRKKLVPHSLYFSKSEQYPGNSLKYPEYYE
jgi:hypothetical protein